MSGPDAEDEESERPPAEGRSAVIGGDNRGIVVLGDFSFNLLYADGDFVSTPDLLELPLREAPLLPSTGPAVLFGRQDLIDRVAVRLASGRSAQLFGEPDVGKQAIAWAVNRQLAAEGLRGHVVLPHPSEADYDLPALYQRLAGLVFGKPFLRAVDESQLRAAVSGLRTHITLVDCPLGREDVERLLHTFPACTFLLTGRYATLPDPSGREHVQPLTRAAAVDLFSAELGLPLGPIGLRNLQFDHVYRRAEGRPRRLRMYGAFLKSADDWQARAAEEPFDRPAPADPAGLTPEQQAEALAVAISEPARRALVALRTVGVPVVPAALAAVAGLAHPVDVCRELDDRRLAIPAGDALQITAEAAAAVGALGWAAVDAEGAAEGVLALLGTPQAGTVDADLLLSVASGLDQARKWALACRFDKAAALVALAQGRGAAALRLYALGRKAAARVDRVEDLEYYVRTEEHVRKLLHGDMIAVGAATAILGEQAAHAAQARWAHRAVRTVRHLRKAVQTKAGIAVAVGAVAVAGTAVAVAAASGGEDQRTTVCHAVHDAWAEVLGVSGDPESPRRVLSELEAAASKTTDSDLRYLLQTEAGDFRRVIDDGGTSRNWYNARADLELLMDNCDSDERLR